MEQYKEITVRFYKQYTCDWYNENSYSSVDWYSNSDMDELVIELVGAIRSVGAFIMPEQAKAFWENGKTKAEFYNVEDDDYYDVLVQWNRDGEIEVVADVMYHRTPDEMERDYQEYYRCVRV